MIGPRSRTICALSHARSRVSTLSRADPVSCSSARMRKRGSKILSPGSSFATGSPNQRIVPSLDRTSDESAADAKRSALRLDLARQRLAGGIAQGLGLRRVGLRVRHEMEAVQVAHMLPLDRDVAGGRNFRFEHRVLSQAPHEHARAPVDKALGEPLMERVR